MPSSESEWMLTRAPACVIIAAFSGMPSRDSILKPHQSDQTEAETLSFASMSAILYASTAWWNERMWKPNSRARSSICAISSAR